jgi:hypothetical protein
VATGGQLGFSCFFSYNDPNQTMAYQSYLTRIEGHNAVPRVCDRLATNVLETITGGIQGIGKGRPIYSVACGSPIDFAKQTDWTYIASEKDYDLVPNLGGQTHRKAVATAALNVRSPLPAAARLHSLACAREWPPAGVSHAVAPLPPLAPPAFLRQEACEDYWNAQLG